MWCNVGVTPRPYRLVLALAGCAVVAGCGASASTPSGPVLPRATYAGPLVARSLTPLVKDTLVYVLLWTDVPCQPAGPAPSPGSTAAPRPDVTCTLVDLIDAGTGEVLYSVQGPDI
jgi:hypothetical protein